MSEKVQQLVVRYAPVAKSDLNVLVALAHLGDDAGQGVQTPRTLWALSRVHEDTLRVALKSLKHRGLLRYWRRGVGSATLLCYEIQLKELLRHPDLALYEACCFAPFISPDYRKLNRQSQA